MDLKQDILIHGITYCVNKYGLSPYKIRKLTGWNRTAHKDFLTRQRETQTEERKKRKWETEKIRRTQSHVRKHLNDSCRTWRQHHVFKLLASKANQRANDKISASNLWSIAKRQKLICPYTGIKLTRSNISVEHIVPLSREGRNIVENILLVDIWANRMKLEKTFEEFRDKILSMSKHLTASSIQL